MKIEEYIERSFVEFLADKKKCALIDACFAIEASARKKYKKDNISRELYKKFIREYYWIIEPMVGYGINLRETKFSNLTIINGKGGNILKPDLADVIYHIFRCNGAHAKPIPIEYELLYVEDGQSRWILGDEAGGILKMPERIVWALLAVSIFCEANKGITTNIPYSLNWGSHTLGLGITEFPVNTWWGQEREFQLFIKKKVPNPTLVKLEWRGSE